MDKQMKVRSSARLVGISSDHIEPTDDSRNGRFRLALELSEPVDDTWAEQFAACAQHRLKAFEAPHLEVDGSRILVDAEPWTLEELCLAVDRCAREATAAWNRKHDASLDEQSAVAHQRSDMERSVARVDRLFNHRD